MKIISYDYTHLPIPGGGFVTGFLFHPRKEGLLYARTDIGGAYRFDPAVQRWISLIPHVTMENLSQTSPIALALDENHPERLYLACGESRRPTGELAISEDYGASFRVLPMPMYIHGNLSGRGTGERLLAEENRLWFASQRDGLWTSPDRGESWTRLDALPETHLTFAARVGGLLLIGSAGVATQRDGLRGAALYVSANEGRSFQPVPQPEGVRWPGCRMNGLAAQRWSVNGRYLFVTFSGNGPGSYIDALGYSCDSGDAAQGHIIRYPLTAQGLGPMEDISPVTAPDWGYAGIAASRTTPGLVVASTICKPSGDSVYLSRDDGATWQEILHDLSVGSIRFRAPYMRPECNGGHSLIHWLCDLKLNPFDDGECWFTTGTGAFRSFRLTEENGYFTDWSDGIEETVHLNVYSLPAGKTLVLDIVGDLGGFAFTELHTPCPNSFADARGNRYITCINADFPDTQPRRILVTARGNWTGRTKGGLILSDDGGSTWNRLPMPYGLTEEIDAALRRIEQPNVNPGWAALSSDGQRMVWSIAEGVNLPVARVVTSPDGGRHWQRAVITGLDGREKAAGGFKPFSDRMDETVFYGFDDEGGFYVSLDGGARFRQRHAPEGFPRVNLALIDCADKTEIRAEAGRRGEFLMALREHGLWRVRYCRETDSFFACRLSAEGDWVYRAGFGLGRPGGDYAREPKAIYMNARIGGIYGFYRTLDEGKTLERINTAAQMYGEINSIDGDCRVFGRFYLGTGSSGLLCGTPVGIERRNDSCT